ncbi:MAG: VWA domain-containing protein [Acidobacteria bacterium]|nr:VWA domain-containing protein [Acidobacteriota bacterium]
MTQFPLVRRPLAVAALCVSGAVVAATAGTVLLAQRTPNQQRAVISVVDKKGAPVATLATTDLTVREDGIAREVLKVEPATGAMEIAILVDTSTATTGTITDLRHSVKAFAAAIWEKSPDTQIALYTFGERPTLEADFSSSAVNLNRRADRLFAASGSGAYFIDAVIEASGVLKKRAGARPVIVAYVDENGPEFSNRRNDHAFDALAAARASLWTVSRQGFGSSTSTPENRERGIVIGDVTTKTGGRSSTVFDGSAVKGRFADVATQLLAQFVVTYGRPETLVPPDKLEIKLTNKDLRLAAPRWTTR